MQKLLLFVLLGVLGAPVFASSLECVRAIENASTPTEVEKIYQLFEVLPKPLTENDRVALCNALLERARTNEDFRSVLFDVLVGNELDLVQHLPGMLAQLNILAHEAWMAPTEWIIWLMSLPTEPDPLRAMAVYRVLTDLDERGGLNSDWDVLAVDPQNASEALTEMLEAIEAIDRTKASFDVQCYRAAVAIKAILQGQDVWHDINQEMELEILSEWARLIRGELSAKPRLPGTAKPIALHYYIERALGWSHQSATLEALQALVGLDVSGQHRHVPSDKTATERRRVAGVIESVQVAQGQPEGIYEMVLNSPEGRIPYLFSTTSPSFPILEASQITDSALALRVAGEGSSSGDLDILEVGLDMPSSLAGYLRKLKANGTIAFYGSRAAYSEFSNFYEAEIEVDGVIWPSSEHYFQAMKFQGTDPVQFEAIRNAASPALAAQLGRDRNKVLRLDWEQVKDQVMYRALVAKFTQYDHLKAVLLSTGDASLVEHTERDRYWGDGEDGSGRAMLGKLLVKIRERLRAGEAP
jgi:N-glycosidase YbiA